MAKHVQIATGDFVLMLSAMRNDAYVIGEVTSFTANKVQIARVREQPLDAEELATDISTRHRKAVLGVISRDRAEAWKAVVRLRELDRLRFEGHRETDAAYLRGGKALLPENAIPQNKT